MVKKYNARKHPTPHRNAQPPSPRREEERITQLDERKTIPDPLPMIGPTDLSNPSNQVPRPCLPCQRQLMLLETNPCGRPGLNL
eukprot:scaffold248476_cov125-Cyclotella_meneghiniana.AAC.3